MNWFQRRYRSTRNDLSHWHRVRAQLAFEGLETRLAPANVFVVPVHQPADSAHFHTLAEAVSAAGINGGVTIEPGAAPEPTSTPVVLTPPGISIRGDPNVPASILPRYEIDLRNTHFVLENLNLRTLILSGATGSSTFNTITKCLIQDITGSDQGSTFSQNLITGRVSLQGLPEAVNTGPIFFQNNVFTSTASTILSVDTLPGTIIRDNTFYALDSTTVIHLINCDRFQGARTTIANNTIAFSGTGGGQGIRIEQFDVGMRSGLSDVAILNNSIGAFGATSVGLTLSSAVGGTSFKALIQGNDFHNNAIGVLVLGGTDGAGIIDLGGGSFSSLGANNFRSFTRPGALTSAAIILTNAGNSVVPAVQNIFSNNVSADSVVFSQSGLINVAGPLGPGRAFVQTLYNEVLGRTGTLAEIDPWVNLLGTQGQSAVANAIRLSPEALRRVVDQLYIRFLGRQSDSTGRSGWIGFLRSGGTLEQVETLFLTSPEYLSHINTDFVQSLYLNILGRAGSSAELALWDNNIQNVGGLAGVANAFVRSPENRLNSLRTDFQTFLHRTPTDSELAPLVNAPLDLLGLEGLVLSSPEFFARG